MSGQLTIMGEVSVGAIVPAIFAPIAAVTASLQARFAGLLKLQARLSVTPPSIGENITAVGKLLANLKLMLTLNLPGIDFQVAAIAALMSSIEAQLAALLGFSELAATGGILAAAYEGTTASMAPTIGAAFTAGSLGGSTVDACYALILAARATASIGALKGVFIHP